MGTCGKNRVSRIMLLTVFLALISCASTPPGKKEILKSESEHMNIHEKIMPETKIPELKIPEYVPDKEVSSPLHTKTVSVTARNTPLRDVLYMVAEAANLNIVLERGVQPELPISITFKDIPIEQALNIIFDSVDYFYAVKDNILVVSAFGTDIFELGQPNVIQEYKTNVGGDILSGSSSGGGGSVSGDVSLKSTSDSTSFQFWDAMEKTLSTLISSKNNKQGGASEVNYIVNRMTGTIMVTATKKDLEKVRDYIVNLKKVLNRQVLIEARIVEIQLSEGLKFGVDWSAVGKWLGNGKVRISANSFNSILQTGNPNIEINIFENDNLSFLLKALQEQGDVKTLSNPRVNIMNGQSTMLSVGRNTTFISKVETTTSSTAGATPLTTFTVNTNSILSGVMFGLVPYINSNNEITLTITPIVTNLVDLEAKTIGTASNSVEMKLPTVDLREMSTTVKVLDGQLIIIGGLIDKKEISKEDKIPILGNLPIIGSAFKNIYKSYENTELIIMLIPRIVS